MGAPPKRTRSMSAAETVLAAFEPLLIMSATDADRVVGTEEYPLPLVPSHLVTDLLEEALPLFQRAPNVVRLVGDHYVIGDLHGNIVDLLRIFANGGHPRTTRYLFLGDYVDRGDFSLEVITLLLAAMVIYPENVTLIRGNHEFEDVNSVYGFKEQILCLYGNLTVYNAFQELFQNMPIAAILNDSSFCVHGGISPQLRKIEDLEIIDRRMNPPPTIISDIMWSDPTSSVKEFIDSTRGKGCQFGHVAVHQFLRDNKMTRIIRAHQYDENGVSAFANERVVTVFSTSNYKYDGSNKCGITRVSGQNIEAFNLPSIKLMIRDDAQFRRVQYAKQGAQRRPRMGSLKNIRGGLPLIVNDTARRKGSARVPIHGSPMIAGIRTFQKRKSMSDEEMSSPLKGIGVNTKGREILVTFRRHPRNNDCKL